MKTPALLEVFASFSRQWALYCPQELSSIPHHVQLSPIRLSLHAQFVLRQPWLLPQDVFPLLEDQLVALLLFKKPQADQPVSMKGFYDGGNIPFCSVSYIKNWQLRHPAGPCPLRRRSLRPGSPGSEPRIREPKLVTMGK
mmetsp:Transcript_66246/g.138062  ORF Transcript_66246/g.138062 Transcript_66246/m.138062 type:complete len:140 (-) Transcript_66246:117-536(-)